MNRLSLYRLLRRNTSLAMKRHPALEQNTVARVMGYIGAAVGAVYLLFIGVAMGMLAIGERDASMLLLVLPMFLLLDFFLRFMVQQTPSMLIKPYLLLPVPRHAVVECFLLSSVLSGYNWVWLFLFVPYSYIVAVSGLGIAEAMLSLATGVLLVMANSQWYLLVRTLIGRSLLWWALPALLYGAYCALLFTDDNLHLFTATEDFLSNLSASLATPSLALALLATLFMMNRSLQFRFAFEEVMAQEKKPAAMKRVWQFTFLERYGQTGEYLKLELKSILRNKVIRARVVMSLALIAVLSGIIAYTDIYDGRFLLNFWCYYCFAIYGMTTLTKVMCPEGNYIDLLMTQREHILTLLRAKYYFHVAILVVPLLIMLPAVIAGKFPPLMMLAYMLLSSGMLFFIMFQLAVYNKQTLPLDQKVTGKNGVESGFQLVIELAAMFVPLLLVMILVLAFNETTAYLAMAAVGLLFTLLHPLWLRNIYRRMMARKYDNLEGFHASR